MDVNNRNMTFGDDRKMKMTIPERIVLSAGYDGDDNKDAAPRAFGSNSTTTLDETPILNPDDVMGGMQTPPSVLTIDHSSDLFKNNSPSWHTEGDGADDDENQSSFQKYSRQLRDDNDDEDNDFTGLVTQERSLEIAGEESIFSQQVPFDNPIAMESWYRSMQRRLTLLENELDYQNRSSNVWKYFLLTLTVLNPLVVNYFFNRRR